MAIRVNKILSELNMGFLALESVLNALGYKEQEITINTKLPDEIVILLRGWCAGDTEFLKLIEIAAEQGVYGNKNEPVSSLKVVGRIDRDAINNLKKDKQEVKGNQNRPYDPSAWEYSDKQSFWISELAILSPENNKVNGVKVGTFDDAEGLPLYSVLIGTNGAGKSTLMKEIVDFFIDVQSCVRETEPRLSSANKGRLKGIRYHVDGVECEVIRLTKNYFARINGQICNLKELRLPSIVACHFGAFDKLPVQKVNGASQTRYDVPYYKYVGAHVNGSMISSSGIAFRLLFALNEQMDDRQRKNICSILDFIGYDHRISLAYTLIQKAKKDGAVRDDISQRVNKDKEYSGLDKQERNVVTNRLYNFYKTRTGSGKPQYNYDIDFDSKKSTDELETDDELQTIYKLKQYDYVSTTNVTFHKQGIGIPSDEMSSGEFAMLSTVLSISAAANDPHTLVLLDEPELSLHPNWQMTLIDNLDRALKDKVCHLLIATHSHMLVSDLPMKRSFVSQVEKDQEGNLSSTAIAESTYGWSAEEVLLKVFKTATDRNRYFGERIGKLLEQMGNNTIKTEDVKTELKELQEISMHLSDIDPMKTVLNTIVEAYK